MKLFSIGALLALAPGVVYVVWLVRTFRSACMRQLQNEITIGVFWFAAFPAAVGLLAYSLRTQLFSLVRLASGPSLLISVVVVLLNILFFFLMNVEILPRYSVVVLDRHEETQDISVPGQMEVAHLVEPGKGSRQATLSIPASPSRPGVPESHAGLQIFLNGTVTLTATFLLWYLAFLYVSSVRVADLEWKLLTWILLLVGLWVPTTLYSGWFFHSFSFDWVVRSPFFLALTFVVFLDGVLLLLDTLSGASVAIVGVPSFLPFAVGALQKIKPDSLKKIGEFFSELPFAAYAIIVIILISIAQGVSVLLVAGSRFDNSFTILGLGNKPVGHLQLLLSANGQSWPGSTSTDGTITFHGLDWRLKGVVGQVKLVSGDFRMLQPGDFTLGTSPTFRVIARTQDHPVRLGILRSGDLVYTREIRDGLLSDLENELKTPGIEQFDEVGPDEPDSPEILAEWAQKVRAVLDRGPFDYYVGVGTQAAMAFAGYPGLSLDQHPLIFLGVTDPVGAGLVNTLEERDEDRNIAGVAYMSGLETILAEIHRIFPTRKLEYVYNSGYPQDEAMAERIRKTELFHVNTVGLTRTTRTPTLADLPDPRKVYFSWYTFEDMIERNVGGDIFDQRDVVATTEANVRDRQAPIGVSAEDKEIGKQGAQIIVRAFLDGADLHKMDVVGPRIYYWINCNKSKQRGLSFSQQVLAGAQHLYDCPEQ